MGIRLVDSYNKCAHCDSEFRVSSSKQRFCSSLCRSRAYYKANSEKEIARNKEYALKNPHVAKSIKLKRYYGITLETYNQMLVSQNNVCKICKDKCSTGRDLCVDHCHTTGTVRGLLCGKCNTGLGSFLDNVELLKSAICYLGESK